MNHSLYLSRRTRENGCPEPFSLMKQKSRWIPIFMSMAIALTSLNIHALETPHSGHFDRRVRHINFNPQQVVKLVGHYGFATDIAFASNETIKQIAMGDSDAWAVTPVENHIFIKPKAQQAITNMTVLTNHHSYHFELSAHWFQREGFQKQGAKNGVHSKPNDMMFAVQFAYPEDVEAKLIADNQKQLLNEQINQPLKPQVNNQNYFYKGDKAILPVSAFDDGRFTYLKFNEKQDLPAVYTVNNNDSESLVNSHINPDFPNTIVIRRVVKRLVLRQENRVLCLFNQSFDSESAANYRKTQIPQVQRHLKVGDH